MPASDLTRCRWPFAPRHRFVDGATALVVTSSMTEGQEVALGGRDPELNPHREQVLRQTSTLAGLIFGFVIAFVGPDAKGATPAERWFVFLAVVMLLLAVLSGVLREWALTIVQFTDDKKTAIRILNFEIGAAVAVPVFLLLGLGFLLAYAAAILVIGDAAGQVAS